tara:strand:+ start:4714 stop:5409 length:696 start_codon:yes stop_codon:yes gene_type:complete
MNKEETNKFLINDSDNYVKKMTTLDLYARKVNSGNEYINMVLSITAIFSNKDKNFIYKCCNNADNFLKTCELYSNYINYQDLSNIKWIFALTTNNNTIQYEEGLPHTRNNIIFLSKNTLKQSEENLTNTLIHEKIHIYQRQNKNVFYKLIYDKGFKKIDYHNKFIRSNPDTNDEIYLDNETKKIMVCLYRNSKPNSINDVIMKNYLMEHPYEKFAYEIANSYYKDSKYKNI